MSKQKVVLFSSVSKLLKILKVNLASNAVSGSFCCLNDFDV